MDFKPHMDIELLLTPFDDPQRPFLEQGLPLATASEEPRVRRKAVRGFLADPNESANLLPAQRWGLIAPLGKRGDELLKLVTPLRELRQEQQGALMYPALRVPSAETTDFRAWKHEHLEAESIDRHELPLYWLILGDLHEVPMELQRVLAEDYRVGRLAFRDDEGYEAYVAKVLRYEREPSPKNEARALFYTVQDGTMATQIGHYALVRPLAERVSALKEKQRFPASDILMVEHGPGALLDAAKIAHPSVLLSVSHGLGVPRAGHWSSPEEQRRFQGAMSLGDGERLTADDVANIPFLPGGIWLFIACYGGATPAASAYYHWLKQLRDAGGFSGRLEPVLAGLPKPGERPFIAALPQAALQNPQGPLAIMAHADLAWTYSFQDLIGNGESRSSRFHGVLRALTEGGRAGIAHHELMRFFIDASLSITDIDDRQAAAEAHAGDPPEHRSASIRKANLWMLRQDISGYFLLGDPAVQFPFPERKKGAKLPAAPERRPPSAQEITAVLGVTPKTSEPPDIASSPAKNPNLITDPREEAVLAWLKAEKAVALQYGIERAELRRRVAAYESAGRAPLASRVPAAAPALRSAQAAPPTQSAASATSVPRGIESFAVEEANQEYRITDAGPIRRTLIISDLHLGNGGPYEAFAGAKELPALLDAVAAQPTRVVVNGDSIDFLMNDDPLALDRDRAVKQAQAVADYPASAGVFHALGRVLERGGEVLIRLGNHDVELALPEVQAVIRQAIARAAPAAPAGRLSFQRSDAPAVLDIGGARILITHGEQDDIWNRVDYAGLKAGQSFAYAPGSLLVKHYLNPITKACNMRFVNFLKPDFQGGFLTALAVDPSIARLGGRELSLRLLWQLFRKSKTPVTFDTSDTSDASDAEPDLGLAARLEDAMLSDEEEAALEAALSHEPLSFNPEDEAVLGRARIKLARSALKLYAAAHRFLAGDEGERFFAIEPTKTEWNEAERLAAKYRADAVIVGHTHAARFQETSKLVYVNAGTWIWLMQLPAPDADNEVWGQFLAELQRNPSLVPEQQTLAKTLGRFTAVLVEPHAQGGAQVALVAWSEARLKTLREAHVPAKR